MKDGSFIDGRISVHAGHGHVFVDPPGSLVPVRLRYDEIATVELIPEASDPERLAPTRAEGAPAWQRPPSKHPNPVIRALRGAHRRYAMIRLKDGSTFAAWVLSSGDGLACVEPYAGDRCRIYRYEEIEAVEQIPGHPDQSLRCRMLEAHRAAVREGVAAESAAVRTELSWS